METLKTQVDKTKTYRLDEAIDLVKETSTVKFDASVELHVRLGIDTKKVTSTCAPQWFCRMALERQKQSRHSLAQMMKKLPKKPERISSMANKK